MNYACEAADTRHTNIHVKHRKGERAMQHIKMLKQQLLRSRKAALMSKYGGCGTAIRM